MRDRLIGCKIDCSSNQVVANAEIGMVLELDLAESFLFLGTCRCRGFAPSWLRNNRYLKVDLTPVGSVFGVLTGEFGGDLCEVEEAWC